MALPSGYEALILLAVVLLVPVSFAAPILGIQRAARRRKSRIRATAPVLLATAAAGIVALLILTGHLSRFFGLMSLALNVDWLWASVSANRAASRSLPPRDGTPPRTDTAWP